MDYIKKVLERQANPVGQLQGGSFKDATGTLKDASTQGGFQKAQGFGQTQQGDDPDRLKMRDDYGWKMNDANYNTAEEQRAVFDSSIKQYRSEYDTNIAQYKTTTDKQIADLTADYNTQKVAFDKAVASSTAELAAAKAKLGSAPTLSSTFDSWYNNEQKVNVRQVDNNNNILSTYSIPKTVLDKWSGSVSYTGGYVDGGRNFNILKKWDNSANNQSLALSQMGSQSYLKNSFMENPNSISTLTKSVEQYNAAKSSLNAAQNQFNTSYAQSHGALTQFNSNIQTSQANLNADIEKAGLERDKVIGSATSKRQGQIDAARQKYEERTALRRSAYKNMNDLKVRSDK